MTVQAGTDRVVDPLADGWLRPRGPRTAYRVDAWVALALAGGTALSISLSLGTGLMGDVAWWLVVIWVALMEATLTLSSSSSPGAYSAGSKPCVAPG